MISRETMFEPLLLVCPSFQATWKEFCEEWKSEKEGPPLYIALSELARHLIDMLERKDTEKFPRIFAVVERWHLEGDSFVKEAASIGLLEDLQNGNLHHGDTKGEDFEKFLLPESKYWWNKVTDFWDKGILITDDRGHI